MVPTQAVGIDLGTTYSVIAHLNESGEPVTLPNEEGELSTPSVVLFDGERPIVGTEALRNSIRSPDRVIENSKRFMGDLGKRWWINDRPYSPGDVATLILKKLVSAAQERIGPITQAVITVPAQFSDAQRHATIQAGHDAGLERVDVINEPVAPALCYVLGSEGLWFSELAGEQRILVYDLGGGTFDLSLVRYRKNEVSVLASSGDLHLGGINWNQALTDAVGSYFAKEFRDDPRSDPESLQALALEVEQAKRSLSVRPRAALTCSHGGHRKTYQVEIEQFQRLTRPLVDRTEEITLKLLKDNKMGWAHVDVVLVTGGASRMPMIRARLKQLSGRTLNTTLSPDLSIAHGATYYAGMLLSHDRFARSILNEHASQRLAQVKQQSVNARELGILIRNMETKTREPHYLIAPNTPLPASATQQFGTVVPNQKRVHLVIVESGTTPEQPFVVLGDCRIEGLPADLPEGSKIDVTISYDPQARVHVSAKDAGSGISADTEILRQENIVAQLTSDSRAGSDSAILSQSVPDNPFKKVGAGEEQQSVPSGEKWEAFFGDVTAKPGAPGLPVAERAAVNPLATKPVATSPTFAKPLSANSVPTRPKAVKDPAARRADRTPMMSPAATKPIPLCNQCGTPLNAEGRCPRCAAAVPAARVARPVAPTATVKKNVSAPEAAKVPAQNAPVQQAPAQQIPAQKISTEKPSRKAMAPQRPTQPPSPHEEGEDEFWKFVEE